MSEQFDVVALGELLIDFTENGKSNQGNLLFEANPGGAPCNVLAMLQRLGRRTAFIGKVGNDMFGELLADAVREQGICTDNLIKDSEIPTTLAFVHNAEDGDRSFSFYRNPGADMMLRVEDINPEMVSSTKVFHFGTLSMTDTYVAETTKTAVDWAKKYGKLISFDPNYRPLLWRSEDEAKKAMWYGIENCDILKISDDEIAFLTGESDIDKGVKLIAKRSGARFIFATLGRSGSKAYYDGKVVFGHPFIQADTIETTGAGDTFMACVIDKVLKYGMDNLTEEQLLDMLLTANAAAAIITTRKGALRVMPTQEEINKLLGRV